jgi:hypothetical protein
MTDALITVGRGFDDVEDGTYDLTCTGVEAKVLPGKVHPQYNPEGKDSPVFIWKFVFTGTDQSIEGSTSQMTGPKAKATNFITALLGPDAAKPNAQFNSPDFVGKRALGQVTHNDSGYPRVSMLLPLPKGAQGAAAVVATPPPAQAAAAEEAPVEEAKADAVKPAPTSVRAQAGEGDDLPF